MGKSKVIRDQIYRFEWLVCTEQSLDKAIALFALKLQIPSWVSDCKNQEGHFACYPPTKNGLLWFKDPLPDVVAHEAFHATMYAFSCAGLKNITEETEEVFAYYLQWLTREILKYV